MAEYVVSSALETITIILARQPEIGYGALGHQIQNLKTALENLLPLLADADARLSCRGYADARLSCRGYADARQPEIDYGAFRRIMQNLETASENLRPLLEGEDARKSWDIREATYKAVDVVETLSLKLNATRLTGIQRVLARFASISSRATIREVTSEISEMITSLQRLGVKTLSEGDRTNKRQRKVRETYFNFGELQFVGLDSHLHELSSLLLKGDSRCWVISIFGMGGLGKTTLAKLLYNDHRIRDHFECFAWVVISSDFDTRRILRSILIQLTSSTIELGVTALEMSTEIIRVLHTKRCLVVLDDVWDDRIFRHQNIPTATNSSKFIVTSRKIIYFDYKSNYLYNLTSLDDESSWQIFHRIAFSKRDKTDIEDKMINVGKEITRCCGGVPLLVSLLAGLLSTKLTLEEWEAVLEKMNLLGLEETYSQVLPRVIERYVHVQLLGFIYDDLPYYLKPCFLYFSQFPEDLEIPVKRLIQMWIADGVISTMAHERDGHMETMEDVAYRYLSELIERYMVLSGERGSTGKIKTCKMYDLLLNLATFKAMQEIFFGGHLLNASRFSIGNLEYNVQELTELNPRIRSLIDVLPILSWSGPLSIRHVVKRLKFLRVLCIENLTSTGGILTEHIGDLILLRFLSLKNSDISKLPPSIFYLRCLQTLDLRTSATSLKIPNVMWRTENLRHLYMHPAYSLKKGGKLKLGHLSNLQTLVNINVMDLDLEDVVQLGSLKKLVIIIRNMQREFVTTGSGFREIFKFKDNTLSRLQSLGILNLTSTYAEIRPLLSRCYAINKMRLQGHITKLSECHQLSFNLAKLVIERTFLEEDPMATLEKLPNLCVLCLGLESFMGYKLICSQRGFPQLQSLRLHGLHNLEEWGAENGAMPLLSHLDISDCPKLNVIPDKVKHLTPFRNQI